MKKLIIFIIIILSFLYFGGGFKNRSIRIFKNNIIYKVKKFFKSLNSESSQNNSNVSKSISKEKKSIRRSSNITKRVDVAEKIANE